MHKNFVVGCLAVLVLFAKAPSIYATFLVNVGNLELLQVDKSLSQGCFPRMARESCRIDEMPSPFIQANRLNPNWLDVSARWSLGRAALFAWDLDMAHKWLSSLTESARSNPILYSDLITMYANQGFDDRVIDLYERYPDQKISNLQFNLIGMAYADLAIDAFNRGERSRAEYLLQNLQRIPSKDLLVQYRSYLLAVELGRASASQFPDLLTKTRAIDVSWYQRPDWREAQVDLVINMIDRGEWSPESIVGITSEWNRSGNTKAAEQLLEKALSKPWVTKRMSLLLAELYVAEGDFKNAAPLFSEYGTEENVRDTYEELYYEGRILEKVGTAKSPELFNEAYNVYHTAYLQNPALPFALHRLIELDSSVGKFDEAQRWRSVLLQQLSNRQPEFLLNQNVQPGLFLLGYDMLGESVSWRENIPICVWWAWEDSQKISSVDGYVIDEHRFIQCTESPNLAPNAGFEQDGAMGQLLPSGYPINHYQDVPLSAYRLVNDPVGVRKGKVLEISISPEHTNTGLASNWITIDPDKVYLMSSWVRAPDGGIYLGYQFLPGGKADFAAYGTFMDWAHPYRLIQPPSNTTMVQIWLLNVYGFGTVYYDDVIFLELNLPNLTKASQLPN